MLRKNKEYMKILLATTFGVLILLGALIMKVQEGKIDALKDELYLKQQNEQRATDYYESTLNIKTIQQEFNTLQEYAVLKNNVVNMNHRYYYTADGMLGLDHKIMLEGRGQVQYDVVVNYSSAIVSTTNNGRDIKIQLQKPYLDENSIKLKENTLIMENTNYNFWSNKKDGTQAQKFFIDSFVDSGRNKLLDYYRTQEKQNYINKVAIAQTQTLIRTLNINGNCNVVVEIIE
jgi:hypothetical protein